MYPFSSSSLANSAKSSAGVNNLAAPEAVDESSVARICEGAACDEDCLAETCVGEGANNCEAQTVEESSGCDDKTISKEVNREGCLSDSSFQSVDNTQRETISNGDVSDLSDDATDINVNSVEHLLCTDILNQQLKHSAS